jgi:ParB-like chromosome segregation protein Spo0J
MSLIPPVQQNLAIVYQSTNTLKPRSTNPRTHSKKQISQIAIAIGRFGFTNPILVDDTNGIIAGHGRLEAAKIIGLDQVPTVRLSAMSEAEIRAYVIADNRLAENAGWDRDLLGIELKYLSELEIDFDVTVTGFDLAEIDILIEELSPANAQDPADEPTDPGFRPGRNTTRKRLANRRPSLDMRRFNEARNLPSSPP